MLYHPPQGIHQPPQISDQVMEQLPTRQRSGPMNRLLRVATTSQVQQRPRLEQRADQSKPDKPKRLFTKINMALDQTLQQMLEAGLITLRAPLRNPNTSAPNYHPTDRCAYQTDSQGHTTDNCWPLKNKFQDMIDAGEIQFEVPETPNIITAPLPNHG